MLVFIGEIAFRHDARLCQGLQRVRQFAIGQTIGVERPPDAKSNKVGLIVGLDLTCRLGRQLQQAEHLDRQRPGLVCGYRQGLKGHRVLGALQLPCSEQQVGLFVSHGAAEIGPAHGCLPIQQNIVETVFRRSARSQTDGVTPRFLQGERQRQARARLHIRPGQRGAPAEKSLRLHDDLRLTGSLRLS